MTKANDIQIGGDHYKKGGRFEHWDVVSRNEIGYLEGYATKYLARWRDKNGLEDVDKARHATVKLIELVKAGERGFGGKAPIADVMGFSSAYDLWTTDDTACTMLFMWTNVIDLGYALDAIDRTIARAVREGWKRKDERHIDKTGQSRPFGYDYEAEEGR